MQNLDILTIQIYKWIGRVKQMYIESKIESRFGNDGSRILLYCIRDCFNISMEMILYRKNMKKGQQLRKKM